MNSNETIGSLLRLLDEQTELIERLGEQQSSLQEIVANKDWEGMERIVPKMTGLSEAISRVEMQRNSAMAELTAAFGGTESFSLLLDRLPPEIRRALSVRYRALKVAVLRLQSRTATMDAYIRASMSTSRGVLQELFPETTSRGYSRDGAGSFTAASAVVVDHEL